MSGEPSKTYEFRTEWGDLKVVVAPHKGKPRIVGIFLGKNGSLLQAHYWVCAEALNWAIENAPPEEAKRRLRELKKVRALATQGTLPWHALVDALLDFWEGL